MTKTREWHFPAQQERQHHNEGPSTQTAQTVHQKIEFLYWASVLLDSLASPSIVLKIQGIQRRSQRQEDTTASEDCNLNVESKREDPRKEEEREDLPFNAHLTVLLDVLLLNHASSSSFSSKSCVKDVCLSQIL
jgi:hypothetical protein